MALCPNLAQCLFLEVKNFIGKEQRPFVYILFGCCHLCQTNHVLKPRTLLTIDQKYKKNKKVENVIDTVQPIHLNEKSALRMGGISDRFQQRQREKASLTNSCPSQSVRTLEKNIGVSLELVTVFKDPFQMAQAPSSE